VQFAKTNFVARKIDNLRGDLAPASVEKNGFLAVLHPQNIARVMRFGSA
jgi:hypothetical protein